MPEPIRLLAKAERLCHLLVKHLLPAPAGQGQRSARAGHDCNRQHQKKPPPSRSTMVVWLRLSGPAFVARDGPSGFRITTSRTLAAANRAADQGRNIGVRTAWNARNAKPPNNRIRWMLHAPRRRPDKTEDGRNQPADVPGGRDSLVRGDRPAPQSQSAAETLPHFAHKNA